MKNFDDFLKFIEQPSISKILNDETSEFSKEDNLHYLKMMINLLSIYHTWLNSKD